MQPGLTLEHPRTGFQVASVHSILEWSLTVKSSDDQGNVAAILLRLALGMTVDRSSQMLWVAHPVVEEDIAVVPEFLDDS